MKMEAMCFYHWNKQNMCIYLIPRTTIRTYGNTKPTIPSVVIVDALILIKNSIFMINGKGIGKSTHGYL